MYGRLAVICMDALKSKQWRLPASMSLDRIAGSLAALGSSGPTRKRLESSPSAPECTEIVKFHTRTASGQLLWWHRQ